MKRVVSLVPSVTETLLAWGVEPVAVTRFCEQPSLRHVGGTKNPSLEEIVDLAPDLVVMDEEENRREDAEALRSAGLVVHVTAVRSLDDVGPTLDALAAALELSRDRPPKGRAYDPVRQGPRAFVPIWRRPYMTINADTYGSSLLSAVGVENVFASSADRYPTVTLEDATAKTPNVVIAPSEPYAFDERHRAELGVVAPVKFVDGRDLFWWGVRTPLALKRLRGVIG